MPRLDSRPPRGPLARLRWVRRLPADVKVTMQWHRVIVAALCLLSLVLGWLSIERFVTLLLGS